MKTKLLIVEDQFIEANNLKIILEKAGYSVCGMARSVPDALAAIEIEKPDMVLLDIFLDGPQTGIDLAGILYGKNIAFIYLSANSNKQTLNAAKATSPYGFLVKPFRKKDVLVMLDIAIYIHQQKILAAAQTLLPATHLEHEKHAFDGIIGQSKSFIEVLEEVKIVGRSESSILIYGESGTGKELIAKAAHAVSKRSTQPLIVINCAALPPDLIESEMYGHEQGAFFGASEKRVGKFEQANGGTIFLDEIGELPLNLQAKFLRVLQEREIEPIGGEKRPIDVRIIAATNRRLEEEMALGRFRMDLYYRLNVFPIALPPLRDRKDDILPLAIHFVNHFAAKENKKITGLSEQAIKTMNAYPWPGNVRELKNIIERGVLLATGRIINTVSLPITPRQNLIQD